MDQLSVQALAESVLSAGDPYAVLQIPETASFSDIRAAYRQIALRLHPDKSKCSQASEAFKKAGSAFTELQNQLQRSDRWHGAEFRELQGKQDALPIVAEECIQSARATWSSTSHLGKTNRAAQQNPAKRRRVARAGRSRTKEATENRIPGGGFDTTSELQYFMRANGAPHTRKGACEQLSRSCTSESSTSSIHSWSSGEAKEEGVAEQSDDISFSEDSKQDRSQTSEEECLSSQEDIAVRQQSEPLGIGEGIQQTAEQRWQNKPCSRADYPPRPAHKQKATSQIPLSSRQSVSGQQGLVKVSEKMYPKKIKTRLWKRLHC